MAQLSTSPWQFKTAGIPFSLQKKNAFFKEQHADLNSEISQRSKHSFNTDFTKEETDPRTITSTIIGNTYFDLQTNASICNSFFRDNNATLNAVWNFAPADDPTYLLRGTGYNSSDGTNWEAIPTHRIEITENGWPSVTRSSAGQVLILTHNLIYGQLQLSRLLNPLTNLWSENLNILPTSAIGGVWWPRMVSGNTGSTTLHVISLTLPQSRGGELYNSQDGALLYSRSVDDGTTWDISNQTINDIGPGEYFRIRPDNYAIDANGSSVAIVTGGFGNDLLLLKSTDNGSTWSSHIIMKFPISHFNDELTDVNGDGIADTLDSNDGSLSVLIDNSGSVHVWAGYVRIFNSDVTDHTISYIPTSNGILYYDESMGDNSPRTIAGALDLNGNGILDVTDFGTFNSGLASQPNASIDADGNLYLAYAAVVENDPDATGKDVRHTYLTSSRDGGLTWSYPSDVVFPSNNEGIFCSMARRIDHTIQFTYQRDECAGLSTTYGFPDNCNTGKENKIIYSEIPAEQILGIDDAVNNSLINLYPNPSKGIIHFDSPALIGQQASVTVSDLQGRSLFNFDKVLLKNNAFNFPKLNNGIYLLNIRTEQLNLAEKITIVK